LALPKGLEPLFFPPAQRAAYLERVTALLACKSFGNGDVQRAAAKAQRERIGAPATE
jgi:hypothetical protein